ncbi:HAUS augmin-like complex subunit 6 [Callorhinchus milii]|nr:HAUS augmin-like complex subunit 6 [Callorhinchus milii]|eukprot:gi/632950558/ref/XP_007890788.1/ PREDICTED: HAUS augmin-like complex subunit 6 [Callorhinchus milii]
MEAAATSGAKERLWSALLALGFSAPEEAGRLPAVPRGGVWRGSSRTVFGKNMFDKPNMDAFQTVAHYLFVMLDQTRSNSLFRDCWPIYDKKMAVVFRKACYEWLKKIADKVGSTFPQVVASLFLSPGGPKFINLMYHFSKYVLIQKYNEKAARKNSWLPIEMSGKQQNLHLAAMKSCIASNRFLEGIQKEAFVVGEYQKKEELLVKENKILRKPSSEQKHCLEKSSCGNAQEQLIQKQKELQAMWNVVMDTLSQLERETDAIESIVKGNANRYTLDGTNAAIKVPRRLLLKAEDEMDQIGNLYEAGKLSMRAIIQLCNSSLKLCEKEYHQIGTVKLGAHHDYLKRATKILKCELSEMEDKSQKITEIVVPSIKLSITKMENAWDKKWEQYLSRTGFSPVKKKYPVLDLLPVMPAWSFEAASEEVYKNSVFCSYPALLPVSPEKTRARDSKKDDYCITSLSQRFSHQNSLKSLFSQRLIAHPVDPTEERFQCLMENITEMPVTSSQLHGYEPLTPYLKEMEIEQKDETPHSVCLKKTKDALKKRDDLFQKASDQLAEEVANAIAADSPQSSEPKGMALDKIFESILTDPFVTRAELPRTPENLITDIKMSWRCAVQETEREQEKLLNEMPSSPTTPDDCGEIPILLPEESPTPTSKNVSDWPTNEGNISLNSAEILDTKQSCYNSPDRKKVPSVWSSYCLLDENTSSFEKEVINLGYLLPKTNENGNRNVFPKADVEWRSKAVGSLDNSKGSNICCSGLGSEDIFDYFSSGSTCNYADHELSKEPTMAFKPQMSDSGEDYACKLLKNNLARSLISGNEANPDQCFSFLNLTKSNLNSPIKKEKLSKCVAVEIYKKFAAFENSGSSSSLGTESDLQDTLPWNESQRLSGDGEDGGILQETIPDEHGNESWNSPINVNTDQVNTCGTFKSDLQALQSRYNRLRKTCLGTNTIYGANQEQCLTENAEAVQFDSKDESELGLDDVDYYDNLGSIDKRDSVDKCFFLDQNFLRTPSPVSSQHQIPSLGLFLLNDSVPEDEFYKIQLLEKKEPQRKCTSSCENSVYEDTLPDGVEQLINF